MDANERRELLQVIFSIPSRQPRPNRYADVSRFGTIGVCIGIVIALLVSRSILGLFLLGLAGGVAGGVLALSLRRLGFSFSRVAVPNRKIEIARCIGCGIMSAASILASVLNPNALFIFATLAFGWYAVRYFQRQRALAKPAKTAE